ncbi:hypothetical protein R1sor_010303 [Riccia sorocarpa]|uniref:Uncharacterized protein n=1 Tax=Riccia sorocarpa TaxID=122646 RepID=A0ABD3HXM2_9MARC
MDKTSFIRLLSLSLIEDHPVFRNESQHQQAPVIVQLGAALDRLGHDGLIDGTFVKLSQRPCNDGETYFDRKHNYSLNVQKDGRQCLPATSTYLEILGMLRYDIWCLHSRVVLMIETNKILTNVYLMLV